MALMRFIFLKIIKLYQKTLSLDHGLLAFRYKYGFCRFYPTCSEYAAEAIRKFGVLKGGWLALKRVLRCNPWNRGGFDPVK